jgi:hypothetical protein
MKEYSKTIHLIDKGLEGGEEQHGWEEPEAQLVSKACVPHLQHGVEQCISCLQRIGEQGG